MVRKSLKDVLPCETQTERHNEKTKNTLNYTFKEIIDENKENWEKEQYIDIKLPNTECQE